MWVWEQAEGDRKEGEDDLLLAKEERLARAIMADLLAAFLSAALLPVYTLKKGKVDRQIGQGQVCIVVPLPALQLAWVEMLPSLS